MTADGPDTPPAGAGPAPVTEAGRSPHRGRAVLLVGLVVVLALHAALAARCTFVTDDAFITFRYAERLADGHGITYNPPPFRAVEGYSELLWMLVLAGAHRLGLAIPATALALSWIASMGTTALLVRFLARGLVTPVPAALAGGALVATLPVVSVWTTGGLATAAFTFAILALHVALTSAGGTRSGPGLLRVVAIAAATALVVLLRIDGVAWAASLLVLHLVTSRARPSRDGILTAALTLAVATAIYLGVRGIAHGTVLPHTAVQKVGLDGIALAGGARYLGVALLTLPALTLSVVAGLVSGAVVSGRTGHETPTSRPSLLHRGQARIALGMTAVACAYAVVVGGDFMPMARLLLPAAPFAGILAALALDAPRPRWLVTGLLVAGVLGSIATTLELGWPPRALTDRLHFRWNTDAARTEMEQLRFMRERTGERAALGRILRTTVPAGTPITLEAIGAVGFHSGLPVLDQHGLVMHPDDLDPRHVELVPRRSVGHRFVARPAAFLRFAPFLTGATLVDTPPPGLPVGRWVPENRTGWEMLALPVDEPAPGRSFLLLARDPALGRPDLTPPPR